MQYGPTEDVSAAEIAASGATVIEGCLDRASYHALIRSADVLLLPYLGPAYRIGTSAVFAEARWFGRPVIARAQAGTSEFIHDGIEGLLAVDDGGLADALALLGRDPALGERIAAHNVTVPPEQTWDHACDRASALYAAVGA